MDDARSLNTPCSLVWSMVSIMGSGRRGLATDNHVSGLTRLFHWMGEIVGLIHWHDGAMKSGLSSHRPHIFVVMTESVSMPRA